MKRFIICLMLMFILVACQNETPVGYDSFEHLNHWDDLNDVEDGIVVIYFYSEVCPVCIAISEDVFHYAHIAKTNHHIYFIETSMIHEQGMPDFDIPSTPSLIILEQNELLEIIRGPLATVEYLRSLTQS